jgi:hypothetical protein
VPLSLVATLDTPCLSISRESEKLKVHGPVYRDRWTVQMFFEYFAPPTPRNKLESRWPLLENVWHALWSAVAAGQYDAADVYTDAGVIRVHDGGQGEPPPDVTYLFGESADFTWPIFQGRIRFEWEPPTEADTLVNVLELYATQLRPDNAETIVISRST